MPGNYEAGGSLYTYTNNTIPLEKLHSSLQSMDAVRSILPRSFLCATRKLDNPMIGYQTTGHALLTSYAFRKITHRSRLDRHVVGWYDKQRQSQMRRTNASTEGVLKEDMFQSLECQKWL